MNLALESKKRTIIVLHGLPRAGKSTFSKRAVACGRVVCDCGTTINDSGMTIVSRDSIRKALHGAAFVPELEDEVTRLQVLFTEALFLSGHDTIIMDECHINRDSGKHVLDLLDNVVLFHKTIDTPVDICIQRARDTNQEYLIDIINRMEHERTKDIG